MNLTSKKVDVKYTWIYIDIIRIKYGQNLIIIIHIKNVVCINITIYLSS